MQAKLLRVLQSGQLQRLGSDREHHVDVRLIVATNRDLAAEVRAGRLRADIYHRLSVYPLPVPPLRERGRDVLVLSGFFLEENRSRLGLGGLRLDHEAQAALLAYDWPGNVRELEHLVGRSVLKALGRHAGRPRILSLTADDLGLGRGEPSTAPATADPHLAVPEVVPPAGQGLREQLEAVERQLVQQALAELAAAELNLKRTHIVATVDGYVTNLNIHKGDYARTGEAVMAVVDEHSFWVYGFFEETKLPHVKVGDKADMQLMSGETLKGHVESISRGIYDRDNPASRELIADVNPTFNWVRLAQRVPVRIHIDEVPDGVLLAAGMTCTVVVDPKPSADAHG